MCKFHLYFAGFQSSDEKSKVAMSFTELNVQSGLWQTLLLFHSDSGLTIEEVLAICCELDHDAEVGAYFKPGATGKLRNFIKERPYYFRYDSDKDRVSLPEGTIAMVLEECLVEFMALQVRASQGSFDITNVGFDDFKPVLPQIMKDHMNTIYGESLMLFLRTHPGTFICSGNTVKLAPNFEDTSTLANKDNMNLASFFLGLLQKIGATKENPCAVDTLRRYIVYMDADSVRYLSVEYHGNLNLFFLINSSYFKTTKPEKGSVYVRKSTPGNQCVVAHLKKKLQMNNAFTYKTGLTLHQLASEGKRLWFPAAQSLFSKGNETKTLEDLLECHRNIFRWQPNGKVCLRKNYCSWKANWNPDEELLAVAYFIEVLRGIGATSNSSPICFNYILCCAELAPAESKDYLQGAFPGIDILDLFHLHPTVFDFSSTNCISLKSVPTRHQYLPEKAGSPERLSAQYAAQLLRYAPTLTADLLKMCVATASPAIRDFCLATVKGRLQTVIEAGRKIVHSSSGFVISAMQSEVLPLRAAGNGKTDTVDAATWTMEKAEEASSGATAGQTDSRETVDYVPECAGSGTALPPWGMVARALSNELAKIDKKQNLVVHSPTSTAESEVEVNKKLDCCKSCTPVQQQGEVVALSNETLAKQSKGASRHNSPLLGGVDVEVQADHVAKQNDHDGVSFEMVKILHLKETNGLDETTQDLVQVAAALNGMVNCLNTKCSSDSLMVHRGMAVVPESTRQD